MPSPRISPLQSALLPSMSFTLPTMSQGQIIGFHVSRFIMCETESYLLERKEYDSQGNLLWHVQRDLASYDDKAVLPQESTIVYRDGTVVTSKREYGEVLEPVKEYLYIDGVLQMEKNYHYEEGKLITVDQTLYTLSGDFSRRQQDILIAKEGKTYAKRSLLDQSGGIIQEFPEVLTEELSLSGLAIDL